MATYQSSQVSQNRPITSHGEASYTINRRFVVQVGANTAADRIEFGKLPDYARLTDMRVLSSGAVTLNIGDADVPNRYFAAQAIPADTLVRMTAATGFRRTPSVGKLLIVGVPTANGAAGTIELWAEYVVEDPGVAYSA